jgi:hypothetical protein
MQRDDLRVEQVAPAERPSNCSQTADLSAEFNWETIMLA